MTFLHRASRSHRRRLFGSYSDLILGAGPIAYFPQNEASGAVINCLTDPAMNGTATGYTWANDLTGPFGMPAPYLDGTNDYGNVLTAALVAAWDAGGAEWSILAWWKVANAGVWTDSTDRRLFMFNDSVTDRVYAGRSANNNQAYNQWTGGGVTETHTEAGLTTTGWNCTVMTRSEAADQVKHYRNAALLATDTVIGNWASATPWGAALIGSKTAVPANAWHGWIGPVILWPRALPQAEVTAYSLR